jgi:prepilin peptidase CpaA
MILLFILVFCALIALGFGAAAGWSDMMALTIPNRYVIAVALAFIPAFFAFLFFGQETNYFSGVINHFGAAAVTFLVTFILFLTRIIGGGDAKLVTAYALWVGFSGLMPFLFYMAVTGGLMGLATLALNRWKTLDNPAPGTWIAAAQAGKKDVPYGVAIFTGALIAFWQVGYLRPDMLLSIATLSSGS